MFAQIFYSLTVRKEHKSFNWENRLDNTPSYVLVPKTNMDGNQQRTLCMCWHLCWKGQKRSKKIKIYWGLTWASRVRKASSRPWEAASWRGDRSAQDPGHTHTHNDKNKTRKRQRKNPLCSDKEIVWTVRTPRTQDTVANSYGHPSTEMNGLRAKHQMNSITLDFLIFL